MPKIKFTYFFNDYFDRVFDAFAQVKGNVDYKNLLSNLKFYKGELLDEENSEFSFYWKNYYYIKMIVDKVIKQNLFRSLIIKSIYIDKLPIQITLILNFYWDSINEKTIFILEIEYQEEFFAELIKNDIKNEDIMNICKGLEEYLSTSLKGLETYSSIHLNVSLEKVWKYLLYPNLFFSIVSKDIISIPNENEINLNEIYELYTKSENSINPTLITSYIVTNITATSNYYNVTYNTYKKISFPNIKLSFSIKKLDNKKCLFYINIKPNEPTTYEMNCSVYKFWKKRALEFSHFFEKNKKK